MDDFEKMALRRRKPVFQESVDLNAELLGDLHSRGLLNDDAMEQLKAEKMTSQRAAKLVDWLLEAKQEHAFEEICQALVTRYPSLSKELQTEVKIERGDVIIDDDVMKEAATLVHRKFGTSRRFAETDKKDMTDLIAVKIQLASEEWRQEIEQVREELSRALELCKTKDNAAKELDAMIVKFIKKYEEELVSRAHDMTSTTDLILSSVSDADYQGKLKARLIFLLQRAERVVEERELITREREKAEHSLADLNQRVASSKATANKAESDRVRKEADRKEALIKRLQRANDALEREAGRAEQALEEAVATNRKQVEQIAQLEAELAAGKVKDGRSVQPSSSTSHVSPTSSSSGRTRAPPPADKPDTRRTNSTSGKPRTASLRANAGRHSSSTTNAAYRK